MKRYHYSRCLPTPPLIKIGVWEFGKFIGVVIFSRGASSNIGKPYRLKQNEICELTRVALKKHETPVSRIIKCALAVLKKQSPSLRLIVSYADSNQNHLGIIYQASNWIFVGVTKAVYLYRDKQGNQWHSRQVSTTGFNTQYNRKRRCPKKIDCEKIYQTPKYKYLFPMNADMRKIIMPLQQAFPRKLGGKALVPTGEGGSTPTFALNSQGST